MIEVNRFEEVTQIKMSREVGGTPLYWVAAYLVDGLLIDTGCKYTARELVAFLEGQHLRLAVNTHYHEDHIGANRLLQQKFGLRIFAPGESVPFINQVPRLYPYQEMVWGYPEPTGVDCLPPKVETEHFRFDVVDTPGHCKGHVALVEPGKGWCFSGDLFISPRPKVVRPEEDIGEIIRSMEKLVALPTQRLVLFTAMGNIVTEGRHALQECVEHFRDLTKKAKRLEKEGLSAAEIRDKIFGRESSLAAPTDGQFSSENLVRSALRAQI